MTTNAALVAMLLWPVLSVVAFLLVRPAVAVTITVFGGVLLLPQGSSFDFPLVPAIDKYRLSTLTALGLGLALAPRAARLPRRAWPFLWLPFLLVVSAAVTALTNADVVQLPARSLPAMRTHDLLSFSILQVVDFGIPFLLGLLFVHRMRDLKDVLVVIAIAGLLYAPLVLFEIRMSPKLHRMVYGYTPFEFVMTMRLGGWRPTVFFPHGLALAMFLLTTAIAAGSLWRARERALLGAVPWGASFAFLSGLVFACKSLAAIAY